ncbi:nuclear pore complex protein [Cladophialophora carrionii]|uniref:Nuclear pore complex protein n=1 Tax=Cladophialophora carrionii TaxID=86049 RepID=A0A1C1D037_9EURO|nr:nuclear pore complex protein [Cladophialophora carrionii]
MAFSFSNAVSGGSASDIAGASVRDGPELKEIQTNELGFAAINGEAKVQLLPQSWADDNMPPPSSSLLSVASAKGLLAAAGPDAVYITSTKKVREAFQAPPPEKSQTRTYSPEIKLDYPHITQVSFSSDESVLVISPSTGGVVAFQVENLQRGHLSPALEIPADGQSLRALVPNPTAESAELFAIVTTNGDMMLLDLKAGAIKAGNDGNVLKSGVSCLSWSNRGKQLVAGLADGTAVQLKPDGTVVANIPKSTSIPAGSHVSGISWLENDTFFIIYTPTDTSEGNQPSDYYVVQREPKTTNYTFQKLPEVLPPYGVERLPSFHFISRLRNFPPHLQDLLLLAATAATDVGLVSKSDKALSQDEPVMGAFTFTMVEDDSRRAQLPLTSKMQDTSPVGMVVDLSSSERVPNPIPSDPEIEETDGPVPCLFILNNEGVLVAWWVIYNDSVRQKTAFSGFASVQAAKQVTAPTATSPPPPSTITTSTFGTPATANAFAKTTGSTFGTQTTQAPLGAPSMKPFGASSPITSDKPSWTSTGFGSTNDATASTTFGQPAFGSATPMGSQAAAFGSPSAVGSRTTAFGQPSAIGGGFGRPSTIGTSSFGQASVAGASGVASPFAGAGAGASGSGFSSFSKGGFASFAGGASGLENKSPFAAAGGANAFSQNSGNLFGGDNAQQSPFATKAPGGNLTSFASTAAHGPPFGGKKASDAPGPFGAGNVFKLQSSFTGDGSAKDDLPPPKEPGFSFGSAFGDMLGESKRAVSPARDKEAEMDEESAPSEADSDNAPNTSFHGFSPHADTKAPHTLVTPPSTLTQSKATPAPPVSHLFGPTQQDNTTPDHKINSTGWPSNALSSTTPKETPNPAHLAMFGTKTSAQESPAVVQKSEPAPAFQPIRPAPEIKKEPPSDDESVDMKKIPEAPLPPDTVSKPRYASGETSASSNVSKATSDDAPLPPDFLPVPMARQDENNQALPEDDEDDFSSDFEDEGPEGEEGEEQGGEAEEDEDSQSEYVKLQEGEQLQTSPESSFKSGDRSPDTSPTGGLFTKVASTSTAPKPARPLFGEVSAAPVFAPPKPHESPRSPSPIRPAFSADGLRPDPSRSVSAPAHPRSVIDQRKAQYQQSGLAAQAARMREEEAAKEKARREALAREKTQAEAEQLAPLEDDEDERMRQELDEPIAPSQTLDDFVPIQPRDPEETSKSGIPAQIERLYSDINSMVYTLGINCRSLSAYMKYQHPDATNLSWPGVLKSDTPMDALNDERFLTDITRLHEGQAVLYSMLAGCNVEEYLKHSGEAQASLKKEVFDLRNKLMSIRKTIHSLSTSDGAASAPLSAEQLSVQHDLRKSFTSVQTRMVQLEDAITVLRAKLVQSSANTQSGALGRSASQKKPTVEAVTKTVGKMMSMAEQKSADIDVLEAQLKKLNVHAGTSSIGNGDAEVPATPPRSRHSVNGGTPGSAGSVYHTPDSNFGSGTRSRRGFRTSQNGGLPAVSAEDMQRWQAKAQRRKAVASMLKDVLEEKRKKTIVGY